MLQCRPNQYSLADHPPVVATCCLQGRHTHLSSRWPTMVTAARHPSQLGNGPQIPATERRVSSGDVAMLQRKM